MNILAFIGTGTCDNGAIEQIKLFQWSIVAALVVGSFLIARYFILSKTKKLWMCIVAVLFWVILFLTGIFLIFIASFGSACAGYNGFF